jgi:tetratricopeptide (TPR) repeat protein
VIRTERTPPPRWLPAAGVLAMLLSCAACARSLGQPPPLIDPAGADAPHPELVNSFLQQADVLYDARTPQQARQAADLYLQAARADARRVEGLVGNIRAMAWLIDHEDDAEARRRDAVSAVQSAQWCARAAPGSAVCAYWLGAALGLQARERHATALDALPRIEEAFKQAAAAEPTLEQGGPDRALALLYLRAPGWPTGPGDADLGLEHARKAVALNPEYPPNQLALGEALFSTGDTDAGRTAYTRAIDLAHAMSAKAGTDAEEWIHEAQAALAAASSGH